MRKGIDRDAGVRRERVAIERVYLLCPFDVAIPRYIHKAATQKIVWPSFRLGSTWDDSEDQDSRGTTTG